MKRFQASASQEGATPEDKRGKRRQTLQSGQCQPSPPSPPNFDFLDLSGHPINQRAGVVRRQKSALKALCPWPLARRLECWFRFL